MIIYALGCMRSESAGHEFHSLAVRIFIISTQMIGSAQCESVEGQLSMHGN